MTLVSEEEITSFSAESLDECCQAFIDGGNDSMEDACDIRVAALPSELLYDDINMCRTKIVIRTEHFLQDAMSLVRTEE